MNQSGKRRTARFALGVLTSLLMTGAVLTIGEAAQAAEPSLPATIPVVVEPDSVFRCAPPSHDPNVTTCLEINGSGLHVDNMVGTATINNSTRTIAIALYGANGHIIKEDPQGWVSVGPGSTIEVTWAPNAKEPAGTYTAVVYRLNSNNSVSMIEQTYGKIHS
jgi:hypothetical protein